VPHLLRPQECHCGTFSTRARRTSHAVHVRLGVHGRVVADDVVDALQVNAPCQRVGGDEDVEFAGVELYR